MNIGIFSGSFNPVHIGHLILANYITEFTDIDEVWFMVTPQNPFKINDKLLPEYERFEMVKLALEPYPKIKVSDFEFSLPKPSYTINTLQRLDKTYPDHNFSLIIGADNWEVFDKWKDSEQIISNYRILVYPRLGCKIAVPDTYKEKVSILNSPIVEISSTFVRNSIADGKNIRAFLPDSVYKHIVENGFYK